MSDQHRPEEPHGERYQDCVIRDGRLIGDFERLYRDFEDPWCQSAPDSVHDSRRILAASWCHRLRKEHGSTRVIELGCGFGHLTSALQVDGFAAVGIDVSPTAIARARLLHPESVFLEGALSDFPSLARFDPDIFLMPEITWYILNDLSTFLDRLRAFSRVRKRPVFLIHLLTTYPPGVQEYGVEVFTDLPGILAYFDLSYLESGFIQTTPGQGPGAEGTYFVARV